MDKQKIINELNVSFDKCKKELGFKSSFQEIEDIFYLKDCTLKDRFIGEKFSRQLCKHIVELFMSWNNYLHNLVFPNPGYIIGMMESKIFDDKEKKEISSLMSEAMGLVSTNMLVGLNGDKKMEAKFIDDSVDFWNKKYEPELIKIVKKINDNWMKK